MAYAAIFSSAIKPTSPPTNFALRSTDLSVTVVKNVICRAFLFNKKVIKTTLCNVKLPQFLEGVSEFLCIDDQLQPTAAATVTTPVAANYVRPHPLVVSFAARLPRIVRPPPLIMSSTSRLPLAAFWSYFQHNMPVFERNTTLCTTTYST